MNSKIKGLLLATSFLFFTNVVFPGVSAGGGKPHELPLHNAIINNRKSRTILNMIDNDGYSVNQPDAMRMTPLHHAAAGGRLEIVQILIQRHADITARDIYGKTPLHYAAENGRSITLRWLLEHGGAASVVNVQDTFLRTPLHYAAILDNGNMIKYLINIGRARVDLRDRHSHVPEDYVSSLNAARFAAKTYDVKPLGLGFLAAQNRMASSLTRKKNSSTVSTSQALAPMVSVAALLKTQPPILEVSKKGEAKSHTASISTSSSVSAKQSAESAPNQVQSYVCCGTSSLPLNEKNRVSTAVTSSCGLLNTQTQGLKTPNTVSATPVAKIPRGTSSVVDVQPAFTTPRESVTDAPNQLKSNGLSKNSAPNAPNVAPPKVKKLPTVVVSGNVLLCEQTPSMVQVAAPQSVPAADTQISQQNLTSSAAHMVGASSHVSSNATMPNVDLGASSAHTSGCTTTDTAPRVTGAEVPTLSGEATKSVVTDIGTGTVDGTGSTLQNDFGFIPDPGLLPPETNLEIPDFFSTFYPNEQNVPNSGLFGDLRGDSPTDAFSDYQNLSTYTPHEAAPYRPLALQDDTDDFRGGFFHSYDEDTQGELHFDPFSPPDDGSDRLFPGRI